MPAPVAPTTTPAAKSDDKTKWAFIGELDLLYARGNNTIVRGSNNDASGAGFGIGSEGWTTGSSGFFNYHFDYLASIGGGERGLDGTYLANLLFGLFVPITPNIGPYLRVGAGGEYRGNDSYLYSHLDLPEGQAGFMATANGYSLEAGADAGFTIGGRYNTGNDQRRVLDSSPMWGGYAQIHLWPVLVRGQYRTYVQQYDHPVPEEWKARACVAFPFFKEGAAAPIDVCFDGSWMHGAGFPPAQNAAQESHVYYTGVSIGLGGLISQEEKKSTDRPSDDKDNAQKTDERKTETSRTDNPQVLAASGSATVDADDMRRLTREAMSHFGGSRTMQEWLGQKPRPIAVVLPFASQLKEPLPQDVLDVPRLESETWMLNAQVAAVIDRGTTDRALAANGGFSADSVGAVARAVGARYAVYGWVESPSRAPDTSRTSYSLVMRMVDVTTNAIVWQHKAEMTKMVQGR
jgi:hypothetical protein